METTIFSFSLVLLKISVAGFLLPKDKWRLEALSFQKDLDAGSRNIQRNIYEHNGSYYTSTTKTTLLVAMDKDVKEMSIDDSKLYEGGELFEVSSNLKSEITPFNKIFNNNSLVYDETLRIDSKEYESKIPNNASDENIFGRSITEDTTLPIFLYEPENTFIVKNRPAVLKCKVAHALQINFKCSGSVQPIPSVHDKHVDPHTGVYVEEVTTTIKRDLLDEFFGKGPFRCECQAWSSRGLVKSQSAVINIAYIRKQFVTSPTSLKVEYQSRAELFCEPPSSFPEPKITWIKNNTTMLNESGVEITPKGSLLFHKITLKDMANYSCIAENIAGKRLSDSAVMIVYVNGGWSSWSAWKDCKCPGQTNHGKKRTRSCNNPVPMNGGEQCLGPQIQKTADCLPCQAWTWSHWSDWSSCTSNCVQTRHRKCVQNIFNEDEEIKKKIIAVTEINNSNNFNEKYLCSGKDVQTIECSGGDCEINEKYFDWVKLGLFVFIVVICFVFGGVVICWIRRGMKFVSCYNMKTELDTKCVKNMSEKNFEYHIENANSSYDYANVQHISYSVDLSEDKSSEHHYDVPNFFTNYSNPIDDLNKRTFKKNSDNSTENGSMSSFNEAELCGYPTITYKYVNDTCAILDLYNGDFLLYIPEFALSNKLKYPISLQVLNDDSTRVSVPSSETLIICSNIIQCDPQHTFFDKPVILKLPHCLVDVEQWAVSMYYVDTNQGDQNTSWHKISSVGDITGSSSVVINVTAAHIFVITEQIGRFFAIAEKKSLLNSPASIKMKLYAFSQISPSNITCNIRIYIVKDLPNGKDLCVAIETPLGGTFIGESEKFNFYIDYSDLLIRVLDIDNIYEHVIPYHHFLNSNSILNCEFNMQFREEFCSSFSFDVEFLQNNEIKKGKEWLKFSISNKYKNSSILPLENQNQKNVCLNNKGCFTWEQSYLESVLIIRKVKRNLCAALDPLRSDERDWRILAKRLKLDQFITFFATKPSPTENILNLWECQSFGSTQSVIELLIILNEIDRIDVKKIISNNPLPVWI